jgi:hypothetical protein
MQNQWSKIAAALSGANPQMMNQIGIGGFFVLMGISLLCSFLVAFLYLHFYSNRATGSEVYRAFPLLGISITAIFVTIQFSLPLSLGLLGALSIVRFRTPIKEPEEIGFIMLVIAVGIACATFKLVFLGVLLVVAVVALLIQSLGPRLLGGSSGNGVIVVSVPEAEYRANGAALAAILERRLFKGRLESLSAHDGQMVISYNFAGLSAESLRALQAELAEQIGNPTFNVFFNRAGAA